jgi:hypothetical protein
MPHGRQAFAMPESRWTETAQPFSNPCSSPAPARSANLRSRFYKNITFAPIAIYIYKELKE